LNELSKIPRKKPITKEEIEELDDNHVIYGVFVGEDEGYLVGCVVAKEEDDAVTLRWGVMLPPYRGLGIMKTIVALLTTFYVSSGRDVKAKTHISKTPAANRIFSMLKFSIEKIENDVIFWKKKGIK